MPYLKKRFQRRRPIWMQMKGALVLDNFEQQLLRDYLCNLFFSTETSKRAVSSLCNWLEDNIHLLSEEEPDEELFELLSRFQAAVKNHSSTRHIQTLLRSEVEKIITMQKTQKSAPSQLEKNLRLLGKELKLDKTDRAILGLLARYRLSGHIEELADSLSREGLPVQTLLSLFTGINRKTISERLTPPQALISSGLIQSKYYKGNDVTDRYDLPDPIAEALQKEGCSPDDIRTHILGCPVKAKLKWDDFSHLEKDRDRLALFLREAIKSNIAGVNILLWGAPGTGKTEFCKTLAEEIGCNLFAVGETDDDGNEPSRSERMDSLRLAQSLLRYQSQSFLMLDEMDDLFERSPFVQLLGGKFKPSSKIFLNRLLENNPTPTIWIVNEASHLDETVIRRMSLVVEIKKPPQQARETVWKRIATARQLDLSETKIKELARLDVSPAILDNAVKFAQVTGQGHEDILFASEGFINAIQGKVRSKPCTSSLYSPELLNADIDLTKLTAKLVQSGQKEFSLCLHGLPGTGKTEYVRQLAEQLGMEVLVKKTSDLMSPYVGENEQNIAKAFQEAIDNDCFLVFDEADSLLGDRRHAVRGWEVSLVNEMLTWMESHPLPFACTTNLMERFDQASLRRFTFKVCLHPLTIEQNHIAFKKFFGVKAPTELYTLTNLTPGDYAVVRKKAAILGESQPKKLIEMLRAESTAKEGARAQIGFTA